MAKYLELVADFTASGTAGTSLVLVNGSTTTGYKLRKSFDLGSPVERPMFSRTIDSFGVRVTGASLDAREVQIPLRVEATTVAQLQTYLDALFTLCADLSHYGGGKLNFRSGSGTYTNTYKVAQAQCQSVGAVHEYDAFLRQYVTIALTVDPYGLADPYDISDDFSTNTLGTGGKYNKGGADWTVVGTSSATIAGGVLLTATTTGSSYLRHTGTPHNWRDAQSTVKVSCSSYAAVTSPGVGLKYIDTANLMYVDVLTAGAGSASASLRLIVTHLGTTSTRSTTAITLPAAGTAFWLVARIENNTVYLEYWSTEPTPTGTPTNSASYTLTATEQTAFGSKASNSDPFLKWNTGGAPNQITYYDWKHEACSYRSWSFPDILPLNASWGGTTDAQAGVYFTNSSTAPTWMLYSWWAKPAPTNLVWNDGGEVIGTTSTTAYGWGAGNHAFLNAATITRVTTQAYEGTSSFEIVTAGGSANMGRAFPIYHRFKKGVPYVFECYVKAASGTETVQLAVGHTGDSTTSTALALSTTWTKRVAIWTPTADRETADFAIRVTSSTAQTFYVDRVMVYQAGPLKDQWSSVTLDDPVTAFTLGESSGNVTDSIGSRTGTVNGNPTYGNIGAIPGLTGTCMDFDGTGDYINIAYSATDNPSVFTYEAWARVDGGAGGDRIIVSTSPAALTSGLSMYATSGNVWAFRCYDAGGVSADVTSGVSATLNQWFHLAGTYDGTTLRFYVDGRLVGISTDTFVANTTQAMRIGAWHDATLRMFGNIQHVRVYNRALDPDTITRRAQGGPPSLTAGAFGPGIINAANFDAAKASLSSDGAFFGSPAADANYRSGYEVDGSGSMTTTANLEYFFRPDLFAPDDFTQGEVEIAVFARGEVASTQTSLNCAISAAPEGGTSFGSRIYSGFRSTGKTLTLPDSGTRFKPYYLGKLTCRVDKTNPVRWKLRLAFTNSVSATGTFGLDYLILVPANNIRSSRTGAEDSVVPDFIASTSQTTKLVRYDGSALTFDQTTAGVNKAGGYPDEGLAGENILLNRTAAELLVWPSDQVVDRTDASDHSMALAHTATVQVAVQPQHHVLRQA